MVQGGPSHKKRGTYAPHAYICVELCIGTNDFVFELFHFWQLYDLDNLFQLLLRVLYKKTRHFEWVTNTLTSTLLSNRLEEV